MFLRVSGPDEDHWVGLDLSTLELSVFAVSHYPNGRGLTGSTAHHAIFSLHTGPALKGAKPAVQDAFVFDLRDGSSRECPELSEVFRDGDEEDEDE